MMTLSLKPTLKSTARITAMGTYVPERIMTNEDLERMVETNDEWIVQRTGIKTRHIAAEDEFTSDLCIRAVERLRENYNVSLDDIDFIIAATTTPDYPFPTVSCRVQQYVGNEHSGAIDLNATCAGFTYALYMANSLISSGLHRKVLVVAGETMSKITDYSDRSTCILFGDGAGAFLVEHDPSGADPGFEAFIAGTQGSGGIHVYRSGLSSHMDGQLMEGNGKIYQNGREVFKWAVRTVSAGIERILNQAGLTRDDIDWFVPHSANLRMIESICEKSSIPLSKTLQSVQDLGNTSSASIPLALQNGIDQGLLKQGDRVLLYGFGSGLTHAGLIIRWGVPEFK